jgi:RNA polymerase sigma-70 factor (ECF subfamily)
VLIYIKNYLVKGDKSKCFKGCTPSYPKTASLGYNLTRFPVIESQLIERLQAQDGAAQKWVYDHYGPMLFSVCRRYMHKREDAEEAMGSGMFKIFTQIQTYTGAGSFEGWMRRIVVNEALMMLRKGQNLVFPGDDAAIKDEADHFSVEAELSAREILELLDRLPNGYRTVFNLYVIEGFKHQEIADILGISINTSKSQLILAKEKLKQLLIAKGY